MSRLLLQGGESAESKRKKRSKWSRCVECIVTWRRLVEHAATARYAMSND